MKLLNRKEVERRVGLSCSSLYRLMASGQFPRPVRVGSIRAGAVRWWASEIDSWLSSRPRAGGSDAAEPAA